MLKRITAFILAVLLMLGCTMMASAAEKPYVISNAEELKLLAKYPGASFEIVCDIDFAGKTWTAVGTEQSPFTGTIKGNGYEITNVKFADAKVMGFIGYNAGTIEDVNIFEYSADASGAELFGGLVAVNNGTIRNCTTTLGTAKVTAANGAKLGQIAAVNNGTIEKTVCAIDVTVKGNEAALIGGLTAVNIGTVSDSEAAGRMIVTGKPAAGLLAGKVESGSVMETCRYTGTMATVDGELMKTMLPKTNTSECLKDCLWRDNTSSPELLNEEARQTRQKVLDYSNDLATKVWYVGKDISYPEPDSDNSSGGHSKFYKQGEIWYGMEYSHRGKHLGTFAYSIDENNNLKDFIGDGPDGIDLYMSNDCSGIMVSSMQVVSPSVHATSTRSIQPGYTVLCFGDNHFLPIGYQVTEKARTSGKTHDIYTSNSIETIKESFAQALPGDGANSSTEGHARLFVAAKIMRDKNNVIDTEKTIIYMNGMGDGITRAIYHTDVECYGAYTLQELLDDEWIVLTSQELKDGKAPKAEVSLTDEGKNDFAHICQGIVHSNYALWGCRMQVLDSKGELVWEHMLWEKVYKHSTGSNFAGRHSYYEFNLNRFATSFIKADLTEGKTYQVKVSALLADRGEYPVREFSFKY